MRLRPPAISKRVATVILVFFFAGSMCSCRSGWMGSLRSGSDPFFGLFAQDHVNLTRSEAAMTLMNYRVKPATALVGKRFLSVEDCRGLALRNNLELQVARLEELTKRAIEFSSRTKLLPHFIVSSELGERDNVRYTYSDPTGQEGSPPQIGGGGTGVNVWSTGQERTTWRYVLETRWSPTDAALAYYLARSAVNDSAKAHYQKVRVAQKLVGVVDGAFFRLLSLQQCVPMAQRLVAVRSSIADARKQGFEKRLETMEACQKAKKRVATARRVSSSLANEMERQRNILASALGMSPDYCVDGGFVAVGRLAEPSYHRPMCELEMIAVQSRPEAYQAGLNHLNSINDLRRAIVKYFPRITGYWRQSRDKDKYIFFKDWNDVGVLVYFDLLEWLGNLGESRAVRYTVAKTRTEIGTVALGITSQVRLAALKYFDALDELNSAKESVNSSRKILHSAEDRYSREALDRIGVDQARAELLQDLVRRTRAVGEAQATLAELYSALGTNYNEPLAQNSN